MKENMKHALLAASLSLMVAVESSSIKWVKKVQKNDIPSEQLVFLIEIVKLFVSLFIIFFQKERAEQQVVVNGEEEDEPLVVKDNEGRRRSNLAWYLLPAALYAISNNVTFAALTLMSPALFNLLMNLKIPMTALLAWIFLSYKITPRLVFSFILLSIGSAFATLKIVNGTVDLDGSVYGLLLMIVYSSCSAGAAVYMEYVTKMRFSGESIHVQNIRFCICSAVANVLLMMLRGQVPYVQLEWIHWLSVLALAMNGLVTAAVIKYGGSILKTYAVSVAMFLSALFTWWIFGKVLTWNFYVGAVISAISVNLYALEKMR
jgi:drug/metabolite transporter (DMT)-like permease